MMRCDEVSELISAYVDDELPHDVARDVAEHLALCASCAEEHEAMQDLVASLRLAPVSYQAPDVLRARVRDALRQATHAQPSPEAAAGLTARPHASPATVRRPRAPRLWSRVAAGIAIALASSAATWFALHDHGAAPVALADEVLSSHIRSLQPGHLTDVASSDEHNVKPWFNGRLDFSPSVPRLEAWGFPLLGGRLDYVGGHVAAVAVYGRRRHVVNVYSWPAPGGDTQPALVGGRGYHLLHWRSGGTEWWVTSDLNVAELREFVALLRRADAAPARAAPLPAPGSRGP